MNCCMCGLHILNEEASKTTFYMTRNNSYICEKCLELQNSMKYYIAGKEVTKEEYERFLEKGEI